jgi:hypothetical protein
MKLYFYIVALLFLSSEAFARIIRVASCTIPFDFTVGSICVLSTIMWWVLAGVVIAFLSSIFRSK